MTQYVQQTLTNFRVEKGYYTTREVAEIYHVTPHTVRNWLQKKWLPGEMREPVSSKAKTMKGRYRIFPQAIEDIEKRKEELIEASRPYWMRAYAKLYSKS